MIERSQLNVLKQRLLKEKRAFIQVIYGPRQVGKTTLINQFIKKTSVICQYISADNIPAAEQNWIAQNWELVRLKLKQQNKKTAILIIDEIQKINNWSEQIKKEWDADTNNKVQIKVVLLGSSRLLLQQGLTESLAGRFETIYVGHWSFAEMKKAFNFTLEKYIWFGGYPGSVVLIKDENRWKQYIKDALIESSISRDILMLTRVDKPALMQRLFEIGCAYSGQILSFTKILGQLHDAGNTTTLANYLHLLDTAGLLGGIEKYSPGMMRQRSSSPKFQVYNTALISAQQNLGLKNVLKHPENWGRWVESAIGAHLLNHCLDENYKVYYWRHINEEIDFVLTNENTLIGIEVKSGNSKKSRGISSFKKKFNPNKLLVVGKEGMPVDEFLLFNPLELF